MNHVMLDLETLGTKPGCIVLSIGATKFGPDGVGRSFYSGAISLRSSLMIGLSSDAETCLWWAKQSDEAKVILDQCRDQDSATVKDALNEFNAFLWWARSGTGPLSIWGNGADFDLPILTEVYRKIGASTPWDYRSSRCYRTLKSLVPHVKMNNPIIPHHAQHDAEAQAEHAVRLMKALGVW